MPFDSGGIYTPPNGAENAFPGQIIASATWNAIFTDISTALTQLGKGQVVDNPRILTTAGPFTITATNLIVVLNKAAPSATVLNLPTIASRLGAPLWVFDYAGNAGDITINANGAETIMGLASWKITSSGGAGFGGSLIMYPISTVGWVVK